ncbi:hypothetical protein [Caminibacter sp.]
MKVFERIDSYFYQRPKKEFIYILILIVLITGFLIYWFVFPAVEKYYAEQKQKFATLTNEFNNLQLRLNVFNARKTILAKKIKQNENKLASLQKKKIFYSELINLLDFAEFDQYKWANLVKSTVADAKSKGMIVKGITNKIYDVNITTGKEMPNIVKRMDIGISLEGKYKNFIYYLYSYEDRKELIRVKEMNITSPATFQVVFSVYGYNK